MMKAGACILAIFASVFVGLVQADSKMDSKCGTRSGPGPCALTDDVFLKTSIIELGIHRAASFGAATRGPANYTAAGKIFGFICDYAMDGFNVGNPAYAGDYFVPGDPLEGWILQYTTARGVKSRFVNKGLRGEVGISPDSIEITSDDTNAQQSVWTAHTNEVSIKITTTLPYGKRLFFTETVITNTMKDANITDLYFLRAINPDQTVWWDNEYNTYNYVKYQPQSFGYPAYVNPRNPNMAAIVARGVSSRYRDMVFVLGAVDPRAFVSHGGFGNSNPEEYYNRDPLWKSYGNAATTLDDVNRMRNGNEDVMLTFKESVLRPGEEMRFKTYFALSTDFEEDIKIVSSASPSPSPLSPSLSSSQTTSASTSPSSSASTSGTSSSSASSSATSSRSASPSVTPSPSAPGAKCYNTDSQKVVRRGVGVCPKGEYNHVYIKSQHVQLSISNKGLLYSEGTQPSDFVNTDSFDEGFGFVCDYAGDGFKRGNPPFTGDFVDSQYLGWGVQSTYKGKTTFNRNDKALFARQDVRTLKLEVTRDDGLAQQSVWHGTTDMYNVDIATTIPAGKKYFYVDATVTNVADSELTNVIFSHQISPNVMEGIAEVCVKYQPRGYGYTNYAHPRIPNLAANFARSPFNRNVRLSLAAVDSRAFANQFWKLEEDISKLHDSPSGDRDWLKYGGATTNVAADTWTLNAFNNYMSMNFKVASLAPKQSATFRTYFGLHVDFENDLIEIGRELDPQFVNAAAEMEQHQHQHQQSAAVLMVSGVVVVVVVAVAVVAIAMRRRQRVQSLASQDEQAAQVEQINAAL